MDTAHSLPGTPSGPIVGIDLGTTNSLVAVAGWPSAADAPRIVPDEQGHSLVPSVVRFLEWPRGAVEVGRGARAAAAAHPRTTISSVKRLMGRSATDAKEDVRFLPYEVVEGDNRTARVALPAPIGRTVSPQEVSAHILSHLRAQAERGLGVPVRRAVVTVPAYFDDAQRQATRDAGRLAGLDVEHILAEPTAAALAYGLHLRSRGTSARGDGAIVVYDLGGGTFDVSVLRVSGLGDGGAGSREAFEVLATAGDTHLGGDDFDHALIDLFSREIGDRFFAGGAVDLPPATRQGLRSLAEAVKVRLSDAEAAPVRLDLGTGRVYERTITRAEFEALTVALVDRTIAACRRAIRDAHKRAPGIPISAVVLVGGATRMPMVRRRCAEHFGIEPYTALDPDLVVALGAAVQGAILAGNTGGGAGDALLLDVVPLSLGIETAGGAFAKLIMRNSTVPCRATERFSTQADGQTSVKLHILQGEREMASDCRSLGVFHLSGIPPMPAGIPRLVVEFAVDGNGILAVSAVEERSGKRAALQVVPAHGLSRDEVERIERESFVHARADMVRHRIADLIANSELDLRWTQRQWDRHARLLDEPVRRELEEAMAGLRSHIAAARDDWHGVDADALSRAKDRLDHASVRLHEVAIAESLKGSSAQ